MKKFLALFLSIVMALSLSVTVFASDTIISTDGNNSANAYVTGIYTPTYTVTINADQNGTVTAKDENGIEKSYFAAGETVTLTVTPNEGYTVSLLNVKDTAGNVVAVSEVNAFVMPAAAAVVTVTFVKNHIDAEITDMTVTVTGARSYDADTKTYTVDDNAAVTVTVTGNNFENLSSANVIKYGNPNGSTTVIVTEMTVNTAGNTATMSFKGSELKSVSGAVAFCYTNNYSDNATDVTWSDCETKVLYYTPIINVGVTWGSMSFTYSDVIPEGQTEEEGWSCENGANKVTVTNDSEKTVSVSVKYVPNTDYSEIVGSFDVSSANVVPNANRVFTLTLSNKPDKALTGEKIGTITVTVADEVSVPVTTADELKAALTAGGMVKLKNDVELTETLILSSTELPAILDLNGHTLSDSGTAGNGFTVLEIGSNANVTLTDGSAGHIGRIVANVSDNGAVVNNGTLTVAGGTIENEASSDVAVGVYTEGTITVTEGTLKGPYALYGGDNSSVFISEGTLEATSAINPALKLSGSGATAYISGGTFTSGICLENGKRLTVIGSPVIKEDKNIKYNSGILDLSKMTNIDERKVNIGRADCVIGENLLLPVGYGLYDSKGQAVTGTPKEAGGYTVKRVTA